MILGEIEDYRIINMYVYTPKTYIKVRDLASDVATNVCLF